MNQQRRILALLLAGVLCVASTGALACGEVMYRMGGALHYRAFITKHPANILLYAGTASDRNTAEREAFHHNLEKAGHRVTVVDSPEALPRALAEHPFDIVIAYAADLAVVNANLERAAREPSLIPVFSNSSEERAAQQKYPLAVTQDANFNQFLKTIERSMQGRGT